jgi:hypothetical protein
MRADSIAQAAAAAALRLKAESGERIRFSAESTTNTHLLEVVRRTTSERGGRVHCAARMVVVVLVEEEVVVVVVVVVLVVEVGLVMVVVVVKVKVPWSVERKMGTSAAAHTHLQHPCAGSQLTAHSCAFASVVAPFPARTPARPHARTGGCGRA